MRAWKLLGVGLVALAFAAGLMATPLLAAGGGKSQVKPYESPVAYAPVSALSWSGIYLGAHGGYSASNLDLGLGGLGLDGLSATGSIGGLHAGADLQIPGSWLVVGARGGYFWNNGEFTITSPGGTLFRLGHEDGWNVDGRVGAALGTALPYVFVGYTKSHTSGNVMGSPITTPDLKGWQYGAGVEFRGPKSLNPGAGAGVTPTVSLEVAYIDYDQLAFGGGAFTVDVSELRAMGRLNVRFGN